MPQCVSSPVSLIPFVSGTAASVRPIGMLSNCEGVVPPVSSEQLRLAACDAQGETGVGLLLEFDNTGRGLHCVAGLFTHTAYGTEVLDCMHDKLQLPIWPDNKLTCVFGQGWGGAGLGHQ